MCLYSYICVYYVKSVNKSRSLLFHVFIYMCVCNMLRVLICQGVYYFMCLYICVCSYYVKSVNMSRSLLSPVVRLMDLIRYFHFSGTFQKSELLLKKSKNPNFVIKL